MPPKRNAKAAKAQQAAQAEEAKVEETKEVPEEEKMETEQESAEEAAPNADSNTEEEKMDETEGEASAESKDEKDEEDKKEEGEKKTPPKKRGRQPAKKAAAPPKEAEPKPTRGRKRKTSEGSNGGPSAPTTPSKKGAPPTPKKGKTKTGLTLSWEDFINKSNVGERVLSCGDGEVLGHPGRQTSKKPRKVDIVEEEEMKIVQVVAGGVHSLLLTDDNRIFSCGINEHGTVPAEGVGMGDSTDEFAEIKLAESMPNFADEHGKVVMLTAGASFSAALTDKGSVIAWGNLRDQSGEIDAVHPLLDEMMKKPVVIIHSKDKVIAKIAAGENHLAMLSHDGHLFTFGDGTMGQLGRSRRTGTIRSRFMVDGSGDFLLVKVLDKKYKEIIFKDVHAAGYWTAAIAVNDTVYSFGLNNFGHLGTPFDKTLKEEEEQETGAGDGVPKDDRDFRVYKPVEAVAYGKRNYTHMAGVQHIVARSSDGEIFAIGKNTDNALGLGTWTGNDDTEHWRYTTLQKVDKLPGKMSGCSAKLGASIVWNDEGKAWGWGCDTSGQLGLGLKDDDDKVVPVPSPISSAHLDGYKIISVSVADNHSLFLAKKEE